MTSEAETILREALALQEQDRAGLAAELLASLDETPDGDAATISTMWAEELERRAARIVSGAASTESWSAVRDRVANRLNR